MVVTALRWPGADMKPGKEDLEVNDGTYGAADVAVVAGGQKVLVSQKSSHTVGLGAHVPLIDDYSLQLQHALSSVAQPTTCSIASGIPAAPVPPAEALKVMKNFQPACWTAS